MKDVLGYDLFKDVSQEYGVKGHFTDYAIRVGDEIKFLIEVKHVSLRLKEKHLFQLTNYAEIEGVEWCLLTNSANFELYHVEYTNPVEWTMVFETNLIDEDVGDTVEKLWYLTKRSMRRGKLRNIGTSNALCCLLASPMPFFPMTESVRYARR